MTKKEILWREILYQSTNNKKREFTQKELAEKFGFSLSTVFNALRELRQLGVVRVSGRNFIVEDPEKFLYFWATHRKFTANIAYATQSDLSVREAEGAMPPSAIFACYSAYRMKYDESPADYDKVYVYADADGLAEIQRRFPPKKGYANIIVLRTDPYVASYGSTTPDIQTFVDLWNLDDWYAKNFSNALKEKIWSFTTIP